MKLDADVFHLVDGGSNATFIAAKRLFPEEFTDEEIHDGVELFLVHTTAHCMEATRLSGDPTKNPFDDDDDLADP